MNPKNNQSKNPKRMTRGPYGEGQINKRAYQAQKLVKQNGNGQTKKVSRGQALRAQKQAVSDANRIANQYQDASANQGGATLPGGRQTRRANLIDDSPRLKIIGLGGMDGGGSKNMMVVEYQNDAIVIDCGSDLGVDLPGINYGIADTTYLDQIKNKLRVY